MSKKAKITILIVIIVLIVLIAGFILLQDKLFKTEVQLPDDVKKQAEEVAEKESETEPAPKNIDEPANQEDPVVYSFNPEEEEEQRETSKEELKQIAFAISERFGSYSNEGNFGNISDLKIYMTDSMKNWADSYISESQAEGYSGDYYGITTTALVGEVLEFNEDDASFLITTSRREVKDNQEEVFNQDIIINFNKIGDEWKVHEAYWQ